MTTENAPPNAYTADRLARDALAVVGGLGHLAPPPQRTLDGPPGGVHRAARRGGGVEFAEHRDYAPGDDLRHLDWRAYARSDRYTVKRFEQDVHASVTLILDASASMRIAPCPPPDKFEAVQLLCAALATWVIGQGDAVGLLVPGRGIDLAPTGGRVQLQRVLGHIADTRPDGGSGLELLERGARGAAPRRGTVIAVSDLLGEPDRLLPPLVRLRKVGPRVVVLCALHPLELDLGFAGAVELVCGETARRDRLDPRAVRATYSEMIQAHLERLRTACASSGLAWTQVSLGAPATETLRAVVGLLAQRGRSFAAGAVG